MFGHTDWLWAVLPGNMQRALQPVRHALLRACVLGFGFETPMPVPAPCQVGRHYLAEGWGQQLMTLSDFIATHVQPRDCSKTDGPCNAASLQLGYLAQHPLFEQIPVLRRDIVEPEYCALGKGSVQSVNAWFGPAGTVRGWLHGDTGHGVLLPFTIDWISAAAVTHAVYHVKQGVIQPCMPATLQEWRMCIHSMPKR